MRSADAMSDNLGTRPASTKKHPFKAKIISEDFTTLTHKIPLTLKAETSPSKQLQQAGPESIFT